MESALKYFRKRCKDLSMCLSTSPDKEKLKQVIEYNKKAAEALEKQIPKKIIHNPNAGREKDWICPSCRNFCGPFKNFCNNCGQAVYVGEY